MKKWGGEGWGGDGKGGVGIVGDWHAHRQASTHIHTQTNPLLVPCSPHRWWNIFRDMASIFTLLLARVI